jgi:hypothetical protein
MRSKFVYNNISPAKAEFYRREFPIILQCYAPITTHRDFQCRNIIIKRISPSVSVDASTGVERVSFNSDIFHLAIIDWEDARWYPDYEKTGIAVSAGSWWSDN